MGGVGVGVGVGVGKGRIYIVASYPIGYCTHVVYRQKRVIHSYLKLALPLLRLLLLPLCRQFHYHHQ